MFNRQRWIILIALAGLLATGGMAQAQDGTTTHYINTSRTARLRSCPEVSCQVVTRLPHGAAVAVVEIVHGDTIAGSDAWEHIILDGEHVFVHTSLTSETYHPEFSVSQSDAYHGTDPHAPSAFHH